MAGFFGLFNYSKPGKGVRKDEPQKPRFLFFWELFFRKFWKLVQLNLLYVAFCLPIVTIGPATAGFTYVLRNMVDEAPVFLLSDFWDGIKNNWKQSFIYSVLMTAAVILLSVAWRFYYLNAKNMIWMYVPFSICFFIALLLVFMSFYVMLMIVTVDLPLFIIFKNAAILSIICLKANVFTLLFAGFVLLASFFFPVIGALLAIVITPALIGFIICFHSYPGIKTYTIAPFYENRGEQEAARERLFDDEIL